MDLESFLNPVTALAFLRLERLYLLAGEGQHLKVFDIESGSAIFSKRVFAAQAIHGIFCLSSEASRIESAKALIWGGRSVCVLEFSSCVGDRAPEVGVFMDEVKADDWILDACLIPSSLKSRLRTSSLVGVCISAHNEILLLEKYGGSYSNGPRPSVHTMARGPTSILYSAHIIWEDPRQILIASGTVAGEILVWSVTYDASDGFMPQAQIQYRLPGHEGSVFGVRISGSLEASDGPTRLLASCSDDRTILIWDISGASRSDPAMDRMATCIAKTIAHASRIWAVRFLPNPDVGTYTITSFGEDCTALLWLLRPLRNSNKNDINWSADFEHRATYSYHCGKNLWAACIYSGLDQVQTVATGGADGRIVLFQTSLGEATSNTTLHQSTMSEVLELGRSSRERVLLADSGTCTYKRKLFDAMIGEWKLSRTIKSAVQTHPSGKLEGTAHLRLRDVTDRSFDRECIYSEQGDFISDMGFKMKATRQYVYRYQEGSDEISIWFVKTDGETVDYLFHNLDFDGGATKSNFLDGDLVPSDFTAAGHHFCKPDTYHPKYEFHLTGNALASWHIQYTVKGPQKDYLSKASYSPDPRSHEDRVAEGLPDLSVSEGNSLITETLKNSFKSYAWISKTEMLAVTEQGDLMLGHSREDQIRTDYSKDSPVVRRQAKSTFTWELVGHSNSLRSRSIMSSVAPLGMTFLTGNDGIIYAYRNATKKLTVLFKGSRKIGYLGAQLLKSSWEESGGGLTYACLVHRPLGARSSDVFHINPGSPLISPVIFSHMSNADEASNTLSDKEFVTTSSLFLLNEQLLLEGSRNGELRIRSTNHDHRWRFSKHHDSNAITAILHLSTDLQKHKIFFLTTGRNGKYAYHGFCFEPMQSSIPKVVTIHIASPPFGPNIEGAHINLLTGHLILWGFTSTRFIVWNESAKSEIMSVECGGAHRSWSYIHHDDTDGGNLVWTKAVICNIYYQPLPSHRVLQAGGHGREIKAMAILPAPIRDHGKHMSRLVATGAEDTDIRLFSNSTDSFQCRNIMTEHTTGVQKIRWSPDGHRLFSAGGCEEFFAWRIGRLDGRSCVVCDAQCPSVTDDKDLRIMDFSIEEISSSNFEDHFETEYIISMAYSDSSVRIWRFRYPSPDTGTEQKAFTLLNSASYGTKCLTQIHSLKFGDLNMLCTTSSDGHLTLWQTGTPLYTALTEFQRHAVHQNSIKSLLVIDLSANSIKSSRKMVQKAEKGSTNSHLIITGGDDQALALTILTHSLASDDEAKSGINLATLLIPNAHASAITGIASLGQFREKGIYRIATVGNDQRLKTWVVGFDDAKEGVDAIKIERVGDVYTGIADASSLETYADEDGVWRVLVAGIGMECWKLDKGLPVARVSMR